MDGVLAIDSPVPVTAVAPLAGGIVSGPDVLSLAAPDEVRVLADVAPP
jgi:hypothetical protein